MRRKCNLVLAGGGIKGSFSMGAIEEIIRDYEIESVTGTSIGSIIGIYLANDKFEVLKSYWHNSKLLEKMFKQTYTFGYIESLLFRDSLFKNKKLKEAIMKDIDFENWVSNYGLVWTDVQRKEKVHSLISKEIFTDKSVLADYVLASASFSPAYPLVKIMRKIDNETVESYGCDGSYSDGVPVETLSLLTDNFKTEANTTFIILTSNSGSDRPTHDEKPKGFINTLLETVDSSLNNLFDLNVKYGKIKYWEKNRNHVFKIISPEVMIMKNLLDFDQSRIKQNWEQGRIVARKILNEMP